METTDRIKIVSSLQKTSSEIFKTVTNSLKLGMSEADTADLLTGEFEKRGITKFWYNGLHTVFLGFERFKIGTTTSDYSLIAPSRDVLLQEGSTVFIDLSPMDPESKVWGDWAGMIVFQPRKGIDDEQAEFLREMRKIHLNGISQITSQTTGADVANYYLTEFKQKGIRLLDKRNNVGHSIHEGPKAKVQRTWLDKENTNPLGEGIFAVEPGGAKGNLVGRFEECVYIPKEGSAILLGSHEVLPLIVH